MATFGTTTYQTLRPRLPPEEETRTGLRTVSGVTGLGGTTPQFPTTAPAPQPASTTPQSQATLGNTLTTMVPPPPPSASGGTTFVPPPPLTQGISFAPSAETDGPLQDYGPGNDLRGTQINPYTGQRLAGIQGDVDTLRQGLQNFQLSQFGDIGAADYAASPEAQRARQLGGQSLEALAGGPDRGAIAQERLRLFAENLSPELERAQRATGQRAAALGRLGSGMTADDIVRLGRGFEQQLAMESRGLAADTASQELNDRLARLQAIGGYGGQLRAEDLQQAGFQQGLRGEARGERAAQRGASLDQLAMQQSLLGQLGGLEQQAYGQGVGAREEARGERAFQEDQARRAQDIEILRRQLEQQYEMQRRQLALQGAGLYGDQAAASSGAAADLLGGSF